MQEVNRNYKRVVKSEGKRGGGPHKHSNGTGISNVPKKIKLSLEEYFNPKKYQAKLQKFALRMNKITDYEIGYESEAWNVYLSRAKVSFDTRMKNRQISRINLKDFELINTLGKGSYGEVLLAMKKDSEDFYAIKVINKFQLVKKEQILHAKQEKQIVSAIRFQFTVYMQYFFQSKINLFFVLQLVLGKTLYDVLGNDRFNEDTAKFFVAQILLGLEYLHYLDIIYRDLKLENIVMDQTGYIKITDFGFAKILKGRTYTICGTPEYMAPELFEHKGYGMSVDWWAFGILVYELCAGYTPFNADNISIICAKILKGHYKKPNYFTDCLNDLIDHLLDNDITKRFGYINLGVQIIKTHQWFGETNWINLLNRRVKSPITCGLTHLNKITQTDFKEHSKGTIEEKHNKMFVEF